MWRWLAHQFSHTGLRHVAMNSLMNMVLGIPLEEFHGSWRLFLMFNFGVFGGACCSVVTDIHSSVVGMSGGCYALLGMHLADLLMNWAQRKHRWQKLLLMVVLAGYDILSTHTTQGAAPVSHAAHFGGYVAGLLIAIVLGRNLVWKRWERALQALTVGCGLLLIVFCMTWTRIWAPRTIWESSGWCWSRQVSSVDLFGDESWNCVRCASQACIEFWSTQEHTAAVSASSCDARGGWKFTEA